MTYEEAINHKKILNERVVEFGRKLKSFPSGKFGLVDETTRNSKEYREALNNFNKSFSELRKFNTWFMKEFRKKKSNKRK